MMGCDLRVYKFLQMCGGVTVTESVTAYTVCVFMYVGGVNMCVGIVCACINFIVYVS